ncbi:DUF1707 domain-containing protein [Actinomadura sp. NEAU-AAG7]|uniref:DUF1707 SHOCT-like domain-containing protein n=1 Tax=Actinomadura sp. NEAU-AAG7 TaxID=2839640 RepID=UPI001BE4B720|nr:DUF1707 domain-containing protein [Actinomadura sp. NEAU-AAG7]MBT2211313.1 DUF1707 domain-containing protein [Actinomadura sp. NEAU-AAG7]
MTTPEGIRSGDVRVGDAERDAVMVALHDHFAAGRLDREELDERLGTTLAARTRGDLRAVVLDLPDPQGLAVPEAAPARHHHRGRPHHLGHHHLGHHHGRHRHGPPFPLLLGLFLVLAFTMGPGPGFLVVLQVALAVWAVRALLMAFGHRHLRHHAHRQGAGGVGRGT